MWQDPMTRRSPSNDSLKDDEPTRQLSERTSLKPVRHERET